MGNLITNGVRVGGQIMKRVPRPLPKTWEKGIVGVEEQAPAQLINIHHQFWNWPQRSELDSAPDLKTFMSNLVLQPDTSTTPCEEALLENLELHIGGMLEGRIYFMRALQALVHHIFNTYAPGENLKTIEMGCGPMLLLHELAPERLQKNWQAFDLHPTFVRTAQEKAREFNLPARVFQRNIHDLSAPALEGDLWVGLSSYDAVDVSLALEAMRAPSGTKLITIQDLYPGIDPLLFFERRFSEKSTNWLVRPPAVQQYNLESLLRLARTDLDQAFQLFQNFMMRREGQLYYERDGIILHPTDELQDRMLYCLEDAGFDIINHGTSATTYLGEITPEQRALTSSPEARRMPQKLNSYYNLKGDYAPFRMETDGLYEQLVDPTFPIEDAFVEQVVANFIVAEKR